MMTNTFAEQAQRARDLRAQLTEIGAGDRGDQEMQFIEWSPGRKLVKLWSMQDGQEITIPQYMVMGAITKRLPDGRFAFTAHQNEAPAFKDGEVPCFLAANSPERTSGLLEAAGLSHLPPCPAEHLRSNYSKRIHAFNRHRQAWESLQDHVATQEREMERGERRQQTDAMLQMAGSKTTTAVAEKPATHLCEECSKYFKTPLALAGHKRSHASKSETPQDI